MPPPLTQKKYDALVCGGEDRIRGRLLFKKKKKMAKTMVVVQKRTDVRKDGSRDEEDALVLHQIQRDYV